jgi:hypothetical protein
VTVAREIPPPHPDTFSYMVIHVEDNTQASLINNYYECFNFINEGLNKGKNNK